MRITHDFVPDAAIIEATEAARRGELVELGPPAGALAELSRDSDGDCLLSESEDASDSPLRGESRNGSSRLRRGLVEGCRVAFLSHSLEDEEPMTYRTAIIGGTMRLAGSVGEAVAEEELVTPFGRASYATRYPGANAVFVNRHGPMGSFWRIG